MKKKNPGKKKGYRLDTREGVDKFLADIDPKIEKSIEDYVRPYIPMINKLKHDY